MIECRLCENGPCIAGGEDGCPWPLLTQENKWVAPDPKPLPTKKKSKKKK